MKPHESRGDVPQNEQLFKVHLFLVGLLVNNVVGLSFRQQAKTVEVVPVLHLVAENQHVFQLTLKEPPFVQRACLMEKINDDILEEILCYLNVIERCMLLRTSKRFWDFRHRVDKLLAYRKIMEYKQWNKGLEEATKKTDFPNILYFIHKGADALSRSLEVASFMGNRTLVNYFIGLIGEENCYWETPSQEAAKGGHRDLVEFYISKDSSDFTLEVVISGAAESGHESLVKYLIKKSEELNYDVQIMKNHAMCGAASGNHQHLMNSMIEMGANDWATACAVSAASGNLELVEFLWNKAQEVDLKHGICQACLGGNKDVVEFFLNKGATDLRGAICSAASYGHKELVEYLLEKKGGSEVLDAALETAALCGHIELVKFLTEKGAKKLDKALSSASVWDYREIIELLLEKGAGDIYSAMVTAAEQGHATLVEFYLNKGATNLNDTIMKAATHGKLQVVEVLLNRFMFSPMEIIEATQSAEINGHAKLAAYLESKQY